MSSPDAAACPRPILDHPCIVAGHGGGGALSRELVERVFLPAFADPLLARLGDSTPLDGVDGLAGGRLALSTDSYVVRPLFFPGGSIGELAVHGTVNDLAMSGAMAKVLTVGFILEEGLPIADLVEVAVRMGGAARAAGVRGAAVSADSGFESRGLSEWERSLRPPRLRPASRPPSRRGPRSAFLPPTFSSSSASRPARVCAAFLRRPLVPSGMLRPVNTCGEFE